MKWHFDSIKMRSNNIKFESLSFGDWNEPEPEPDNNRIVAASHPIMVRGATLSTATQKYLQAIPAHYYIGGCAVHPF